jgi:hypothetical protein
MESVWASAVAPSQHRCSASPPDSGNTSMERNRTGTAWNTAVQLAACRNMNLLLSRSATRETDTQPNLNPVSAPRNPSDPQVKVRSAALLHELSRGLTSQIRSALPSTRNEPRINSRAILPICADCPPNVPSSFSDSLQSRGIRRKQSESKCNSFILLARRTMPTPKVRFLEGLSYQLGYQAPKKAIDTDPERFRTS